MAPATLARGRCLAPPMAFGLSSGRARGVRRGQTHGRANDKGDIMRRSTHGSTSIGRRRFVQGSVAAAGLGMLPRSLGAQAAGPWSARPAGNPAPLTFVVWQYGKIYD